MLYIYMCVCVCVKKGKNGRKICLVVRLLCGGVLTSRFCLNTKIFYQIFFVRDIIIIVLFTNSLSLVNTLSCKYNFFLTYRDLSYYYYYLCSLTRTQQSGDEDSYTRSNKIRSPTTVWQRRFEHTQQQNPFAYNSLATKIRTHAVTKIHSPCNSLATRNRTRHTKILSSHSTSLETNCEFKHGEKRKKCSGRNN